MSNGVGTTRPDEKTPQTTTRTRSEKREPQQAPMEQYTKVSNRRLEEWARKAGVKMGILMMVQRQTVGWQRMWWTTTVTDLATKIGRGRQSTSKWLGKLVEAGEVVRRDLENDKIMLALAGEAEEEGHVENSGGVSSVDDRGCRRSTTGGWGRAGGPPPPPRIPTVAGTSRSLKTENNRKKKTKKKLLLLQGFRAAGRWTTPARATARGFVPKRDGRWHCWRRWTKASSVRVGRWRSSLGSPPGPTSRLKCEWTLSSSISCGAST